MTTLFMNLKMDLFILIISVYIFTKVRPKRQDSSSLQHYYYYNLGCVLFSISNLVSGMSDFQIIRANMLGGFILNYFYLTTCIYAAFCWYNYVDTMILSEVKRTKRRQLIIAAPFIIYCILCVSSYWNHSIFFTDAQGVYHRGTVWQVQLFFSLLYIIVSSAYALHSIFIKKKQSGNSKGIVSNTLIVLIGCFLQYIYGNNYMAAGMVVGLVLTYIELCSEEQIILETAKIQKELLETRIQHMEEINQSMRVTAAINADYASIYYVDIPQDTFILYKTTTRLRKSVEESVIGKSKFTDTIIQYIDNFVCQEDQERLNRLLSPEALIARLNKDESFFIRYRVKENPQEQENFEMHIVSCGEKTTDYQIALGFRCIDAVLNIERKRREELETALDQVQEQKILIEETFEKYKQADFERRTDFLTGLHNRHDMFQMLHDSVSGQGDPIKSMFMMDIDNFKRLNDRYGHTYGDECLRKLGGALSKYGKANDIVFFRYGGEEMLGIGFSEGKDPEIIAEELLELVRKQNIVRDDTPVGKVTVSIGYTINNSRYEKMIDYADRAMYRAKENGKNQAVSYDTML